MKKSVVLLIVAFAVMLTNCSKEKKGWREAKTENTVSAYEKYLEQYPEGAYVDSSKYAIKELNRLASMIEPGTKGKTYSTSFGSVIITLKKNNELIVTFSINNPESFCLKSGGELIDFIDLKSSSGKNYRYSYTSPSIQYLSLFSGGGEILNKDFNGMRVVYTIEQSDKKFTCDICNESINFEIK